MIRSRARLLAEAVEGSFDEMARGVGQVLYRGERAAVWLWNGFKGLPGVHQVGHGLATVLGLYRIAEREDFEIIMLLRVAQLFSVLALVLFLVDHHG